MLTECKCMSFASWRAELLPLLVFDEIKNIEILIVFLILPPPPKLCHVLNSLAGYIVLHDLIRRKQCTDVSGS